MIESAAQQLLGELIYLLAYKTVFSPSASSHIVAC
jgi:hypothetical protein